MIKAQVGQGLSAVICLAQILTDALANSLGPRRRRLRGFGAGGGCRSRRASLGGLPCASHRLGTHAHGVPAPICRVPIAAGACAQWQREHETIYIYACQRYKWTSPSVPPGHAPSIKAAMLLEGAVPAARPCRVPRAKRAAIRLDADGAYSPCALTHYCWVRGYAWGARRPREDAGPRWYDAKRWLPWYPVAALSRPSTEVSLK